MDNSEGITPPSLPPGQSSSTSSSRRSGQAGQRSVIAFRAERHIPRTTTIHSSNQCPPLKHRNSYNFEQQYRTLEKTLDPADAESIFRGMEKRKLPKEQITRALQLMTDRSSMTVAQNFLDRQKAIIPRKMDLKIACSLENLEKDQIRLKTIAGRLARFISAKSVYEQLTILIEEMRGVDFTQAPHGVETYNNIEFTLEKAVETVKTQEGLSDFIHRNRRFPLLIMVINARMAEGIPLEDATNQSLLFHHQHESGKLLAKRIYRKKRKEQGTAIALDYCRQLLAMTDQDIFSRLATDTTPEISEIIELSPDAQQMPTYISMESFREKLSSYFPEEY